MSNLLYPRADADALLSTASKTLLGYGAPFLPHLITRAEGVYVYTSTGHRILDWTSGQMSCLLGHGNPEIVKTIHDHALSLDHLFSGMLSPPVVHLAELLTSVLPEGLDRAMFLSTGSESNECAIRLAKVYTGKWEIVGLGSSWHGMTGAAGSAQYHSGRRGHGPMIPGNFCLPTPDAYRSPFRHADGSYDWETELSYGFDLIDGACTGNLAAVILEPILSSGGMLTLPSGYLAALRAHCTRRGMLLIVDEAQTALGRCGDLFAFEHDGAGEVIPDILTLSKTLGNGLPLSAVVTSHAIADGAKEHDFMYYTTHLNDPLPAAVGLKVLEIVLRDDRAVLHAAWAKGLKLHAGLNKLKERYACIGDVRGRGLMAGVEIVQDRRQGKQQAKELGAALAKCMMDLGLSANLAGLSSFAGVFRIAPPITITDEELEYGLGIMEKAFATVEGAGRLYGAAEQ